jgi:hypothetical protein
MHNSNLLIYKILLFAYLFSKFAFSQWEAGGGYSVKNQYPFNGLSVFLERKLPYQGAGLGVNFRVTFEHFYSYERLFSEPESFFKIYNSNIDLNLLVNFFYKYMKPFAGLGIGAGNYFAERFGISNNEINISDTDRWKFITKLFAGIKLTFHEHFQPFIQFYLVKYFSSLEEVQFKREIKSAQLGGTLGLSIVLF